MYCGLSIEEEFEYKLLRYFESNNYKIINYMIYSIGNSVVLIIIGGNKNNKIFDEY